MIRQSRKDNLEKGKMQIAQMQGLLDSDFLCIANICSEFSDMMLKMHTASERVSYLKEIQSLVRSDAMANKSHCFLFNATPTQELVCMTEIPKTNRAVSLNGDNVKLIGATIYIGANNTQLQCGIRDNGDNGVKSYVWLNMPNPCDGYKLYCGLHFIQLQNSVLSRTETDPVRNCPCCGALKRQYETILDELEKINQNLSRRRRFVEDTL